MAPELLWALGLIAFGLELGFVAYGTIQVWQYSHVRWHPPAAVGATAFAVPVLLCGGWLLAAVYWLRTRSHVLGRSFGDLLMMGMLALLALGALIAISALVWAVAS